ncbi:MAG: hypothetical protein LBC87_05535 [Fibromonadaceae bacterium]|jgi:hypothetical protein|nr:hypothetical protein [Fibromonadaceae bacterium]
MKNIYFAVALVSVVLLVFSACSNGGDDESYPSSKPGACYLTFNIIDDFGDMCLEGITESVTQADCNEMLEDMNSDPDMPSGAYSVKFSNSCPTTQDYKCYIKGDDGKGYVYLYGSAFDKNSCREFGGTDVGGSTKPSSSSAGNSTQGACYISFVEDVGMDFAVCTEPMSRAECNLYAEMLGNYYDVNPRSSCPKSGIVCTSEEDGVIRYVYGEDADESVCEDDGEWDDGYGLLSKAKKLPKGLSKKLPKKVF